MQRIATVFVATALFTATALAQQQLPAYHCGPATPGTLRAWGSPQMEPLLKVWEAGFHRCHSEVKFADNLKSTVSAIGGVYAGVADLGVVGRTIWPTETMAFSTVTGHEPIGIEVATGSFDVPKATFALGVFVHRSNPLTQLTAAQLEAILRDDTTHPIRRWSDLNLPAPFAAHTITPYVFDLDNDKMLFLESAILHNSHRFNPATREFENSTSPSGHSIDAGEAILTALAHDPYGIAISNTHYANPDVKLIALAATPQGPFVLPTKATVQDHTYLLTRTVAIYPALDANGHVTPLAAEFLRYILSREGQADVVTEGEYLPLTPAIVQTNLKRIQ